MDNLLLNVVCYQKTMTDIYVTKGPSFFFLVCCVMILFIITSRLLHVL